MSNEPPWAGLAYANLRRGGAPAWRATSELGLCVSVGRRHERNFRIGATRGEMRPRFADHDSHVAAIAAAGGFPVLGS
jgi:hypothetical protein